MDPGGDVADQAGHQQGRQHGRNRCHWTPGHRSVESQPDGELQRHDGTDCIQRDHDHVRRHVEAGAVTLLQHPEKGAEPAAYHPTLRSCSFTAPFLHPLPAVDHGLIPAVVSLLRVQ